MHNPLLYYYWFDNGNHEWKCDTFLIKWKKGGKISYNKELIPSKPWFGTGSKWSHKFEKISDWSLDQRSRSLNSDLLTFSRSRSPWWSRSFGKRSLIFQFSATGNGLKFDWMYFWVIVSFNYLAWSSNWVELFWSLSAFQQIDLMS